MRTPETLQETRRIEEKTLQPQAWKHVPIVDVSKRLRQVWLQWRVNVLFVAVPRSSESAVQRHNGYCDAAADVPPPSMTGRVMKKHALQGATGLTVSIENDTCLPSALIVTSSDFPCGILRPFWHTRKSILQPWPELQTRKRCYVLCPRCSCTRYGQRPSSGCSTS